MVTLIWVVNQIHNVKAGTKDTDAVNVSQLKQSIGDVHKRINKVGKEARGGIAGANAAAGLPQVYIPGKINGCGFCWYFQR